jgi:putative transcriptional regulator
MFVKVSTHSEWLPHPIASYVPKSDCKQSWRRAGIGILETDVDFGEAGGNAKIYRIAPGTSVPIHTHTGAEVTLVLSGGFTDETGSYGPGDIAIQEAGGEHQPVADDDGECVVLAVNEGDIRLTGPIGRVLNLLVN